MIHELDYHKKSCVYYSSRPCSGGTIFTEGGTLFTGE